MLLLNMGRRDSEAFRKALELERCQGIVRTVSGLETGVMFVLMNSATLGASVALSIDALPGDLGWRFVETALFFMLHRALGANVFEGRYAGFLQPESMWRFDCESPGAECRIRPLQEHPEPTY
uniref:Uncharacterized protein n=1 Tax=Alexandrium catenella TaxID=2925 RepID=A0A7S1QMR6_ALECA